MGSHALLSASSSKRWIECPLSARMCERYDDRGSDYAAEGTETHALCEFLLKNALGTEASDPRPTFSHYSEEMLECAENYVAFALEIIARIRETCPDPQILIEQKLNFSEYVPGGYGTGDLLIVGDGTLYVCDYKHGTGVLVEAEGNPQLRLYGLGSLLLFDGIYDIETVSMTIFQPRRSNVATETMPKVDLYRWADEVLKPAAERAFKGEGELSCGDWCRFCKAKAECRKRAEQNMELARYDFVLPPTLEDDEIASILDRLDDLLAWAGNIKEYALQAALSGTRFDGWKLVEGRANRRYTDEQAIADAVTAVGLDPFEHKLLGLTAMEKLLGKKRFGEMLGSYVERPQGKPTLVPETDNRSEINTAKHDFADERK